MNELAYLVELIEEQNFMLQDLEKKVNQILQHLGDDEDDDD